MRTNSKIEFISVENLQPCAVQPDRRHESEASVASVMADMENGIEAPLHVVPAGGGRYTIADGHRRWQAAVRSGLARVPCIVHRDEDPDILFIVLNRSTQRMAATNWFYVWGRLTSEGNHAALKKLPPRSLGAAKDCVNVFGRERAIELALAQRVAPSVGATAYVIWSTLKARYDKLPFDRRTVGEWLVTYGTGVKVLANAGPTKRQLAKLIVRIRDDKPFPPSEWGEKKRGEP